MRKSGVTIVMMLLFVIAFGASQARAEDHQLTVVNNSGTPVMVAVVWSGGGLDPAKLNPDERENVPVPSNLDSVKVTVTGTCRQAVETFNPQKVDRAMITCKDNVYTIVLAVTKPAP
ncbi:MAG TPA: hypothetical protein VGH73_24375 [Thermoanaerobaculia bacterium]